MKFTSRIQKNTLTNIPKTIIENYVNDNNIAKWIINLNNESIQISFTNIRRNDEFKDNGNIIILYRNIYGRKSLSIPTLVRKFLLCDKYDQILWIIQKNKVIHIECIRKYDLNTISGILNMKDVNNNG